MVSRLKYHIGKIHLINLKEYQDVLDEEREEKKKENLRRYFRIHKSVVGDREGDGFKCIICQRLITTKLGMKVHVQRFHAINLEDDVDEQMLILKKKRENEREKQRVRTKNALKYYVKDDSNPNVRKCLICKKCIFVDHSTSHALKEHCERRHLINLLEGFNGESKFVMDDLIANSEPSNKKTKNDLPIREVNDLNELEDNDDWNTNQLVGVIANEQQFCESSKSLSDYDEGYVDEKTGEYIHPFKVGHVTKNLGNEDLKIEHTVGFSVLEKKPQLKNWRDTDIGVYLPMQCTEDKYLVHEIVVDGDGSIEDMRLVEVSP